MSTTITLPPSDITLERQLCASLLQTPRLLTDCWPILLSGEVFYDEAYQELCTCIHQLWSENRTVRMLAVHRLAEQRGTEKRLPGNLSTLDSEGQPSEAIAQALHLRELWLRRQALTEATKILSRARNLSVPVDEVVGLANNLSDHLAAGLSLTKQRSFSSYVSGAILHIEQARQSKGGMTGVPTFSDKLNRFFGGWQKVVYMIAGRPGMGKTIVAVLAAMTAAEQGHAVAYISLEVKGEHLVIRMLSEMLLIPYEDLLRGQLTDEQFAQLHKIAGQLERLPIYIYDEENREIGEVRNWLKEKKRHDNIQLAIIDYVQLLEDKTKGGEYEEQTAISRALLKLQIKLDIPFLEFAQLNRKVEERPNKRPNQADLRATGQFEQDASVIALLYRDDYYKQKRQGETGQLEAFDGQLEWIVDKNRNGRTGTHYLYIDVAKNRILDEPPLTPPELSPGSERVPTDSPVPF